MTLDCVRTSEHCPAGYISVVNDHCRFDVSVTGFDWTANYEKTRWFLVMRLDRAPQDGLNELLRMSNSAVQKFGQPTLYTDSQASRAAHPIYTQGHKKRQRGSKKPDSASKDSLSQMELANYVDASDSFHVSIGWTLTTPSESLSKKLDHASHDFRAMRISVNSVKVKIGNSITSIPLASKVDTSHTIIEG